MLKDLGEDKKAVELSAKSLAIFQKVFQEGHPYIAQATRIYNEPEIPPMNRRPFLRRAPSQPMPINSVFISYNRDDLSLIKPLEQALKAKGLTVWRDQERVYGGDNWPKGIGEAIRDTDAVVLCWSNNARQSHFVEMEWSIALALKKVVIPFQMDNTGLHPSLSILSMGSRLRRVY